MRLVSTGLLALVVAVGGCGLFKQPSSGPLVPDLNSPVADVPVPAGFTRTNDSESKQIPGNSLRFVNHRYKGSDGILPVVNFYKEQLPKFKWAAPQIHEMGKEVSLVTSNDRKESCTITVSETWNGSMIHLTINPVGQDGAK